QRMSQGKRGHNPEDVEQARSNRNRLAPSAAEREQRGGQKQREQKEEMVRAFGNVPHSETEGPSEATQGKPSRRRLSRRRFGEREFIGRLVLIAGLRFDPEARVLRNQRVGQVDRN